jgi:hypothetical protein
MFWKRLNSFFWPSPSAMVAVWVALVFFILSSLTFIIVSMSDPTINTEFIMISVFSFPVTALLLAITALTIETRPGGRVVLWGSVIGCTLLGIFNIQVAEWLGLAGMDSVAIFFYILGIPILAVLGIIWFFIIRRAWPDFSQALHAARSQRLILMIEARGETTLSEISSEISSSEAQTLALLKELLSTHELMGYYDAEYQCIYSAAAFHEKQRKMVSILETQGKVYFEALSQELKINRSELRQWIYTQAQRGQLHGFTDWAGGWVYSRPVNAPWKDTNRCPHCGGQLDLAGKGVIECMYCKVEVFA